MTVRACIVGLILALSVGTPLSAQTTDVEFFEAQDSAGAGAEVLRLPQLEDGGAEGRPDPRHQGGPAARAACPARRCAGKPAESRLMKVLSYTDPLVQMPPTGKLPDAVLADFAQWIASGRRGSSRRRTGARVRVASVQGHVARRRPQVVGVPAGRRACGAERCAAHGRPPTRSTASSWPSSRRRTSTPSPQADKRTLVTRAYVDLLGYKPTFEEVQAFVNDRSPNAYANADRSPAGVAALRRAMGPPLDGRGALRRRQPDVGSDQSAVSVRVALSRLDRRSAERRHAVRPLRQAAAGRRSDAGRPSATTCARSATSGAAPIYHHDLRLSGDVIGAFLTDDWDERIDAVSRGVLGISVGCARCHDHKFDPVTQKDYYALMGVFASTVRAERPTFPVDPKVEQEYMWLQRKLFDLAYSINLLGNEGTTFTNGAEKAVKWKARDGGPARRRPRLTSRSIRSSSRASRNTGIRRARRRPPLPRRRTAAAGAAPRGRSGKRSRGWAGRAWRRSGAQAGATARGEPRVAAAPPPRLLLPLAEAAARAGRPSRT